jgi:hypothetical protein
MTHDKRLKSRSWDANYNPHPFFFRQRYSGGFRLVAWTPELSQLKTLVYSILDTFPDSVEVLLKLREEEFSDQFSRYFGAVRRNDLVETIRRNESFVFSDGGNQLCVKRLDTDEHIALDDHGVLFVYYSKSAQFVDLCRSNGFRRKRRKLIFADGHWHIRPKDSVSLGKGIVRELGLESVE